MLTIIFTINLQAHHDSRSKCQISKGFVERTISNYLDMNPSALDWSDDLMNAAYCYIKQVYDKSRDHDKTVTEEN